MWRVPQPLLAGSSQESLVVTVDSDTLVGDLYTYLGSPSGVKNVTFTVDGADVGDIIISNSFAAGSTFQFTAVNNGRFLGLGGAGGAGGPDFGATGEAGGAGTDGGAAITNNSTYPVSINVDNGFLLGGGGGGGGGAYTDTGTGGDGGGGGGGGQGYTGGTGGGSGPSIGLPPPYDGTPGTRSSAGTGGLAGGVTLSGGAGGNGGTWGLGGVTGDSSNILSGIGFAASFFYYGGLGGQAGEAYLGPSGTLTLNGASSEATLRAASRILGETGPYLNVPGFSLTFWGADIQPTDDNIGIKFLSNGNVQELNTTKTETVYTQYYIGGGGTGANYEVRVPPDQTDNTYWGNPAAAEGTWVTISTLQQWYQNYTGLGAKAGLFELRRSDIPGTTSTSNEVMASFYVKVTMESEP